MVPTLEPIITPNESQKFTMPEFTRPTSITVMAEEDCMAMVIPAPKKKLKNWLLVTFFRVCSRAPPAMVSSPPDIIFMPNIKNARPPKSSASISKTVVDVIKLLLNLQKGRADGFGQPALVL